MDAKGAPIHGVLIDLDGTLVDTIGDFKVALDRMRAELYLGPVSEHSVRNSVGCGSETLVADALREDLSPERFKQCFAHALNAYYRYYAEVSGRGSALYPEVREGLAALRDMGLRLACVTNKPQEFAAPLLAHFGVLTSFELVLGGRADVPKKPDAAPFINACEALSLPVTNVLAIGDSVNDVGAARAAGLRVLLVPYGYNHGRPVQEAGADGIVLSLLDAAHWILSNNRAPDDEPRS